MSKFKRRARNWRRRQRREKDARLLREADSRITTAVAEVGSSLPDRLRDTVGDRLRELAFMMDGRG